MYRRASSGRFIGLTTFLIVVVMAVFTWVMYGMAQQVYTMTDIMVDLSDSFKEMVAIQQVMVTDIHSMSGDMADMNRNVGLMSESVAGMSVSINSMTQTVGAMSGSVDDMAQTVGAMSGSVGSMSESVHSMVVNMNRMTYDISKVSYAMSNPMGQMWGSVFPF